MKKLPEFIEELCQERHKVSFNELLATIHTDYLTAMPLKLVIQDAGKLYAQQVAEDVRQRCMENATASIWTEHGFSPSAYVNKDSILNTEIVLP